MGKELKVSIREEHNKIDFNSLNEIDKEYQEAQRREEKAHTSNSDTSSGKLRSINLFDDNIMQQIDLMLNYLNAEEEREHGRK